MILKKEKVRNANKARNSFVTKRAETRISALADIFKIAAGERWIQTGSDVLQRKLYFKEFQYLDSLHLVYNWENRFMSVNYNLQMISIFSTDNNRFEEVGDCIFTLKCNQKGFMAAREYKWENVLWECDDIKLSQYLSRLNNDLILKRLDDLDIMEMEIQHKLDWNYWRLSCESLIGSSTWILIPPVLSMITPKIEECIKFLELFELLGDALVNNKI